MKIGELNMRCGICDLIDFCDEPFSSVCICGEHRLENVSVSEFLQYLENSEIIHRDTEEEKQEVIDDAYNKMINSKTYKHVYLNKFTQSDNQDTIKQVINNTLDNYLCSQDMTLVIYGDRFLHNRHVVEIMNIVMQDIETSYINEKIGFATEESYDYLINSLPDLVNELIYSKWNLKVYKEGLDG